MDEKEKKRDLRSLMRNEKPNMSAPEAQDPRREAYEWIQSIVAAVLVCVLAFSFLFRIVSVVGTSMLPTLLPDDKIIISDLFYDPEYGEIVVLRKESFRPDPIVKRVIATEGQTVDIDFDRGVVSIDGVELYEPYVNAPTYDVEDFSGPVTVPEGCVFVMGDNRNASTDSRASSIGCVDERLIMGKVYLILFPGKVDKTDKLDFSRIGSPYNER